MTTRMGLHLARKYSLGGRDALVLGNLLAAGIRVLVTLDGELMELKRAEYGKGVLSVRSL